MSSMSFMDKLLDGVEVDWRALWEVTIWDKKFNAVENFKQPKVIKYHYFLAREFKPLITEGGDVKLLTTNISDIYTTEEKAGDKISIGEVVAIPWGGNAVVQYYKGKFLTSDNRIATSSDIDYLSNKYLYYFLLNKIDLLNTFYRGSGIKHPSMSAVLDMEVPIPPIEIQNEIVRILDTFTDLTADLSVELGMRKKQFNYYRDKLLRFEEGEVEWKILGDFVEIKRGKRLVKSQLEQSGEYSVFQNSMTPLGYYHQSNVQADTAFIISAGSAGEIGYSGVEFWAADDVYYFITPDNLKSKFLYYFLLNQQTTIKGQVRRSSVPRLSRTSFEKISIPVPPLEEQACIVSILDKFDALTNSITEGLPREIELRQKQYEYYRDLLLSFPKPEGKAA